MILENKEVLFFLFLLVIFLSNQVSGLLTQNVQLSAVIPGLTWAYYPLVNDPIIFSSTGNNTVNVTLYLMELEFPTNSHTNNSASMTGTLTDPNDLVSVLAFTNTGSNGLYSLEHAYMENGTYTLDILAENSTFGWATTQTYVYIGKYNLSMTVTPSDSAYTAGESGLVSATVTDLSGNPQTEGHSNILILYPDGEVLINWSNMTYSSGVYYYSFISPADTGRYNITVNFTQGVNSISNISSFTVESTSSGGGGGGGVSLEPAKPYYDVEVRVDGNKFRPLDTINASIIIINQGDYPDRDATLKYFLINPDGVKVEGTISEFKEIDIGARVFDVSLEIPSGAGYGIWKLWVSYETYNQGLIEAQDTFLVTNKYIDLGMYAFFIILIVAISAFTTSRFGRAHGRKTEGDEG